MRMVKARVMGNPQDQQRKGTPKERGRGRLGDRNRKKKRNESFVKPELKWIMFAFNLFFWVGTRCASVSPCNLC